MIDKEKIIDGLEECVGNGNCTKCQYGKEKQALSCKNLLRDALALLKEQEEIEPKKLTLRRDRSSPVIGYYCSNCNVPLLNIGVTFNYCPSCGRRIKWK